MNMSPPWSRRFATQPERVTVCPIWVALSSPAVCVRCIKRKVKENYEGMDSLGQVKLGSSAEDTPGSTFIGYCIFLWYHSRDLSSQNVQKVQTGLHPSTSVNNFLFALRQARSQIVQTWLFQKLNSPFEIENRLYGSGFSRQARFISQ